MLAPRGLAAPLHRHSREDEFTIVIAGRIGALLGEEIFYVEPGVLIRKPRNQWHTFWSAGKEPARFLEIITPAGFEHYFEEIATLFPAGAGPDLVALAKTAEKYGLEMDYDSRQRLIERLGLSE
jgi:uncharacterized cupin superfamily protein